MSSSDTSDTEIDQILEVQTPPPLDTEVFDEWNSDDDDVPLSELFTWKKQDITPDVGEFAENTGPILQNLVNVETPIDSFLCLFNKELIDYITFQKNLYATQAGKEFYCHQYIDGDKRFSKLS